MTDAVAGPPNVLVGSASRSAALTWIRTECDRAAGAALLAVGAVALVACYRGVSTSPLIVDELAHIAGAGLGAMLLLAVGATVLVLADLTDEWRKLDRIAAALGRSAQPATDGGRWVVPPTALRRPWVVVGVGTAIGVVIVLLAHRAAAGAADPQTAIRAVGVGIVGIIVAAASCAVAAVWTSRTVRLRESRLLAPWLLADLLDKLDAVAAPGPVKEVAGAGDLVVVGAGLRRFHRPGCPALAGAVTELVDPALVDSAIEPCGLCGAQR